jgi:hypothetical protein
LVASVERHSGGEASPSAGSANGTIAIASILGVLTSLLGFLIGARVAKERADRPLFREIYKELFAHFKSIRDAAVIGRPKEFASYEWRRCDTPLPNRLPV